MRSRITDFFRRLRELSGSLFYRLSGYFLFVTTATALVYGFLFSYLWYEFRESGEQWVNWEVAESLGHDLRPFTSPVINQDEIDRILFRFASYNPGTDPCVLDEKGKILFTIHQVESSVFRTEPIEEYLSLKGPPSEAIYGDDHEHFRYKGRDVLFSAARLTVEGKPAYVYVILTNHRTETLFNLHGDTFAFYSSMGIVLITLGLTLPLGITIFYSLTRRFNLMTRKLSDFEKGDYTQRLPSDWKDELGVHARVFNQLADSLTSHIGRLEEMDSSRRELVASISHDLRTPVSAIRASLETISAGFNKLPPEEILSLVQIAEGSTSNLASMLEDLFELSKLEAPFFVPEMEDFPFDELIEDVVSALKPLAEERGISLCFNADEKIPFAWGNVKLLHRAVINLIGNAVRYTLENGDVHVQLEVRGDKLRFEVQDTGIGIPAEELEMVFERFYRAEGARERERSGSGLGLSIVKRVIDVHGEKIFLESEIGKGTRVYFEISAAPR